MQNVKVSENRADLFVKRALSLDGKLLTFAFCGFIFCLVARQVLHL